MKRFLLFSGDDNNPQGGWRDLDGAFGTLEEARAAVFADAYWWQIVDLEDDRLIIVEEGGQ